MDGFAMTDFFSTDGPSAGMSCFSTGFSAGSFFATIDFLDSALSGLGCVTEVEDSPCGACAVMVAGSILGVFFAEGFVINRAFAPDRQSGSACEGAGPAAQRPVRFPSTKIAWAVLPLE